MIETIDISKEEFVGLPHRAVNELNKFFGGVWKTLIGVDDENLYWRGEYSEDGEIIWKEINIID